MVMKTRSSSGMIPMYEFKPESVELSEIFVAHMEYTNCCSVAIDLQEC